MRRVHCKRIFYIGTGIQRENGGIFGDETMSRDIDELCIKQSELMKMVFKTQCGLFAKLEKFTVGILGGFYYLGERMIVMPCRARCCYKCDKTISFNNSINNSVLKFCVLERTNEPYDDKESINKIVREMDKKFFEERKKIEGEYTCVNIIQEFDKAAKEYNIRRCKEFNCMNDVCVVTGEKRNTELVNIFYDIKHVEKQGFLEFETWERDLKYFDTKVARDLAEKYIPIIQKEEPEKLNLRIQTRKTKSLEEDLERVFIKLMGGEK